MIFLCGILFTVAWVWLIVIAFKSDQMIWGIVILLFTLPAFVYGLLNWDKAKTPYLLLVGSTVLMIMFFDPSQIEAAR
ncbi:MAG: hypothetical protein ACI9ZT_000608 [Gammaproteobacteria bacterium]|jgi:hypothetical protein